MHGKTQPKTSAKLSQMLCLPQAAPIMRIGEHDLNGICSDRLSKISKRSYGNVAGQWHVDALVKQFATDFSHALHGCGWVFQIATLIQLLRQRFAHANR